MKVYKIAGSRKLYQVFPVGAVYISVVNTNPHYLFGGTWTQIGDGYFLEISTSNSKQTKQPGLPNIEGATSYTWNNNVGIYGLGCSGAFYRENTGPGRLTGEDSYWDTQAQSAGRIMLSARNYNSIYGNSNTVQPKSFTVYAWYRTA